jgi:hypothetical protein
MMGFCDDGEDRSAKNINKEFPVISEHITNQSSVMPTIYANKEKHNV